MLNSDDPDDIVRLYDGSENPIGKSFSMNEIMKMLGRMFEVEECTRMIFPSRFMPIQMPNGLKRWLNDKFGLMVVMRCRKRV